MTFKKSYVPGILGSVLTLTVIMAARKSRDKGRNHFK